MTMERTRTDLVDPKRPGRFLRSGGCLTEIRELPWRRERE
jgi:hypothetical protein